MRPLFALLALSLCALTAPAFAQEGAPAEEEKAPEGDEALPSTGDPELDRMLESLLAFIDEREPSFDRLIGFLEDNFETPEEFDAVYQNLPTSLRDEVDGQLEMWSFEGGLGLGGGIDSGLSGDAGSGGLFRLSLSGGVVWPIGDYGLPIYYVFTKIPGPWAIGFTGYAHLDNISSATAGLNLRVAYDYLGTTPFIEIGPATRLEFEGGSLAPGVHLDLGYGNILVQGFVQTEVFFDDAQTLTVIAGVRIPWLLFTLF